MDGDVIGIIATICYVLFLLVTKATGKAEKEGRKTDVEGTYENEPAFDDIDKEVLHRSFRTRRDDTPFVDADERNQRYVEPTPTSVSDARSYLLNQLLEGTRSTKSPSARKQVRRTFRPEPRARKRDVADVQRILRSSDGARRAFLMSEIFKRVY